MKKMMANTENSLPSNYWLIGIEDANQNDGETEFDLDLVLANEELPF